VPQQLHRLQICWQVWGRLHDELLELLQRLQVVLLAALGVLAENLVVE